MKTKIREINDCSAEFITEEWTEEKRVNNFAGEDKIISDVLDSISKNDIFYDIGANIGIYAMFAADKIGSGNVVAVEPHPINVQRLHSNAKLNSFNNITILDYAFFDSDKIQSIREINEEAGEGKHHIHTGSGTIDVNVDRGDKVISECNLESPTVMKIDVEGTEYRVLKGMKDSIFSEKCRLIYIELHHNKMIMYGDRVEEIFNILENAGFDYSEIDHRGGEIFIKAEKQ